MKITVYSIEKSSHGSVKDMIDEFLKMISRFAKIEEVPIFNAKIASAQSKGAAEAQKSYAQSFEPYLKNYTIALDKDGEELNSADFSEIFENRTDIRFFIGGAYGFEKQFLNRAQRVISLSRLTYAHKIAKLVLFEQIYRGLCIKNNHPYHKE
ncbi:MAG: 23S rRNA (pseudouridine(1915)-N(3))-methyltransferase RlmH [Campylobacteraceae bacterium]|jgi:23S rRNA (pseudouridine1915-N3)-methyltransferase|nr:23S rRNA (pseudouridine(1915)-N(3))-methyltransferase RlmH [Campylobacteraceae bacterium]